MPWLGIADALGRLAEGFLGGSATVPPPPPPPSGSNGQLVLNSAPNSGFAYFYGVM